MTVKEAFHSVSIMGKIRINGTQLLSSLHQFFFKVLIRYYLNFRSGNFSSFTFLSQTLIFFSFIRSCFNQESILVSSVTDILTLRYWSLSFNFLTFGLSHPASDSRLCTCVRVAQSIVSFSLSSDFKVIEVKTETYHKGVLL